LSRCSRLPGCQPRGSPSRASTFSPAAAIQTPDLSILSDEFLLDERQLEKKNLALEALRKPLVKRLQRKYGYPPDLQDVAVRTVLQQAEVLSASWQPAHSRA